MAKILIVDDSPTELHVLSQMVEAQGHKALTAVDGEQGISIAREEIPDLILMDVVMPGMNGFQATRKLSRDLMTKDIPIIIVTTKDQETDREWGMRQGARAYMIKPVAAKALMETLQSVLELS